MSEGKKRFVRNLICNKMHTIVYILQWGDMVNVLNIGYMWGKQAHTGYSY